MSQQDENKRFQIIPESKAKPRAEQNLWKWFYKIVHNYRWIHTGIGLVGNLAFVVGSFFFLYKIKPWGAYLFIVGSIGMFIGSVGSAVTEAAQWKWHKLEESQHRHG